MFLLAESFIQRENRSPFELLEEDVEVEAFLGIDEGNLWMETPDVDMNKDHRRRRRSPTGL